MRLGKESSAKGGVGVCGRSEEFVQKALLSFAKANDRRIAPGAEIERVTLERQQRELTAFRVELLPVAVDHDDAGAGRRIDEDTALGENRNRLLRIAAVTDQQAGDLAPIVPAADIDRQLIRDRCERAFLDQARNEAVAHLELQIFEGPVRSRQKISG